MTNIGDFVPDKIKNRARELKAEPTEGEIIEAENQAKQSELIAEPESQSLPSNSLVGIDLPAEPIVEPPKTENLPAKPKETAISPMQGMANMVAHYATRLVNHERAQQFVATLSLLVKQQPKLSLCTTESLLASMMACVHLDIMPNTPAGLAYLIPYGNVAQFQIGYKGLCELAYRSGEVRNINAELVFPADVFDYSLGTKRELIHKPDLMVDRTNIKEAVAVYATAEMKDGSTNFIILNRKDIEKIRKTVKARSTDSPWQTWEEEMWKKTAVKKLTKLLPSSNRDNRLVQAVEYDSLSQVNKLAVVDGNLFEGEAPKEKPTKEIKETTKNELEGKINV